MTYDIWIDYIFFFFNTTVEIVYNDKILEFFWSVITTKFNDDGRTARCRR